MAKRGEKRPWRMTYTWPGGSGTKTYMSEDDARDDARRQAEVVGPNGERCTVEVTKREDTP